MFVWADAKVPVNDVRTPSWVKYVAQGQITALTGDSKLRHLGHGSRTLPTEQQCSRDKHCFVIYANGKGVEQPVVR